ncbi:MAG: hypothetical protein MI892_19890, partial [Desulfobacterales bacterium]|nr:hypothetical protein [Desulfobacterales bacterium]
LKGGQVWAWGSNAWGQLGLDPNTVDPNFPYVFEPVAPVSFPEDVNIVSVCAGGFHSLALDDQGRIWAWGANDRGQLGDDSLDLIGYYEPGLVNLSIPVVAITAGGLFSLALDQNGLVWAWGDNNSNQLGNNTNGGFSSTPYATTQNYDAMRSLNAGREHSLVVNDSNNVFAWGRGTEGQLDYSFPYNQFVPLYLGFLEPTHQMAAGAFHSLIIDANDRVWGWGQNTQGQLGSGSISSDPNEPNAPILALFDPPITIDSIYAGDTHSLAVDVNNHLWAWGDNSLGQIGIGLTDPNGNDPNDPNDPNIVVPIEVPVPEVNSIDAGRSYTVMIDNHGAPRSWGTLNFGSSDVNDVYESTPTLVLGFPCVLD